MGRPISRLAGCGAPFGRTAFPRPRMRNMGRAEIPAPHRSRHNPSIGRYGLSFGSDNRIDVEAKAFRYAGSVRRIGFVEVFALQFLDALRSLTEVADDVADQSLLRIGRHQTEQISRLGV